MNTQLFCFKTLTQMGATVFTRKVRSVRVTQFCLVAGNEWSEQLLACGMLCIEVKTLLFSHF